MKPPRGYPVQLSKWLPREELLSITKTLRKDEYVVVSKITKWNNRSRIFFAMYIKERRESKRRLDDLPLTERLSDYLLKRLENKREGISLLKEMFK